MRALLAAAALTASFALAAPVAASGDAASFSPIVLPPMVAGETAEIVAVVRNVGTTTWTSPPVYVAYHWYRAGTLVVWDGMRTPLGSSVAPGASIQLTVRVVTPAAPGDHVLALELVREGVAWFGGAFTIPASLKAPTYAARYGVPAGAAAAPGTALTLPVVVTNTGNVAWRPTGPGPVSLAYHVYDGAGRLLLWDGTRTPMPRDVAPGDGLALSIQVVVPAGAGDHVVRVELVREGVAWFSTLGTPAADVPLRSHGVYGADDQPAGAWAGAEVPVTMQLTNTGSTTWPAAGPAPVRLSYHVYAADGRLLLWDGARGALPRDVAPGERASVTVRARAPSNGGEVRLAWDLVQEGVAWWSERGTAPKVRPLAVRALPASLMGAEWYRIPTTERVVVLTFDCGANANGAPKILEVLAAKQATATFFMCGAWAESNPDLARAIAGRYPVGNHTMTHPDLVSLSDAQVVSELLSAERAIRAVTGVDTHPLFRFPYGSSSARTIALVNEHGYGSFRWTVDTLGWMGTSGGQSVDSVVARTLGALQPGAIVLMHVGSNPNDGTTLDADALARVIDGIRERGYVLVTLPSRL